MKTPPQKKDLVRNSDAPHFFFFSFLFSNFFLQLPGKAVALFNFTLFFPLLSVSKKKKIHEKKNGKKIFYETVFSPLLKIFCKTMKIG